MCWIEREVSRGRGKRVGSEERPRQGAEVREGSALNWGPDKQNEREREEAEDVFALLAFFWRNADADLDLPSNRTTTPSATG